MFKIFLIILSIISFNRLSAQSTDISFISYGNLPTWAGVAVDWNKDPSVHLYDTETYKGHSEFVSRGLGKRIRFSEFKKLSKESAKREYMPFFLYDLKGTPYKNKSGTFNWALRLENYNYDDKPEHLASEIKKLMKLASEIDKSFSEKGIFILTEGANSPLTSTKLRKSFRKNSQSYLNLNQLIKHVGGKKVAVLNPGTAYGLVKLIKNQKSLDNLQPTDIAILKFTPLHIPPVAGILSLKPQTPLSHINLLAKNRGTFNAYITHLKAVPGLKKVIGKHIRLYNVGDKIAIEKISKKEAQDFQTKVLRPIIQIPEIKKDLEEIIALKKENNKKIEVANIGAKATNYYLLSQTLPELTIPSYAIGFKPYFETIKGESEEFIQALLKEKNKLSKENKSKSLEKIRSSILKSNSFPPNLITDLRKLLGKFPANSRIRLRSSTNNEDLPEFNGAGLYESKGFDTEDTDEKLKTQILKIYASLWSERAFQEREYFGIDHSKVGMAILINEAFQKEAANGVIITTLTKDNQLQIIVNAQSGEHSVTNPKEGMLSESFQMNSEGKVNSVYSESSLSPIFIGNKANESTLKTLVEATRKLHEAVLKERIEAKDNNRYGIDIEFKIMNEKGNNKLYFKQVRLLKY